MWRTMFVIVDTLFIANYSIQFPLRTPFIGFRKDLRNPTRDMKFLADTYRCLGYEEPTNKVDYWHQNGPFLFT
jgi:hypothetical protein